MASGERCPCTDGYPSEGRLHRWNLQGPADRLLGRASSRQLSQTPERSIWRAEPARSHEGRRRRRSSGRSKLCGRGAGAVELTKPPTQAIDWPQAWRIIASRYPPVQLFERLTPDRAVWDALFALEQRTNPRVRDEVGEIALVPPDERVSGPGASDVMASFTHPGDRGSATAASASTTPPRSLRRPSPRPSFISKNLRGIAVIRCEARTCASSSAQSLGNSKMSPRWRSLAVCRSSIGHRKPLLGPMRETCATPAPTASFTRAFDAPSANASARLDHAPSACRVKNDT
jgi:hypothetical protein